MRPRDGSRFSQGNAPPLPYSEVHPERFDPIKLLDPNHPADRKTLDAMREEFMNEVTPPEPARQLYGRTQRRR